MPQCARARRSFHVSVPLTHAVTLTALFDAGVCTAEVMGNTAAALGLRRFTPDAHIHARTAVRPGAAQTAARMVVQVDVLLYCL